jgi:hypothetical protein
MNHQVRIASFLLALGAFFLPFLAQPLTIARGEIKISNPAPVHESMVQNENSTSEARQRRKRAKFCEQVQEDVALGIF